MTETADPKNTPAPLRDEVPFSPGHRPPGGPAVRIWLAALLLAAVVLAGLEVLWRSQGFVPSVTDDMALWALHRERLDSAGPNTVVFFGRSHILQEFVPETFLETAPGYDYLQLGIDARHSLGMIRDVAEHTDFAGVVVNVITETSMVPETWFQQQDYLDYYYTQWNFLRRWARHLGSAFQTRLTVLLPELRMHKALPKLLLGQLDPQFLVKRPDRSQIVDYHKVDLEAHRQGRLDAIRENLAQYTQLAGYSAWPEGVEQIQAWIRQIEARGGKVVFVRPPNSGPYYALQEEAAPKARFWDILAGKTTADLIHFRDLPELRDMQGAVGSHLVREDCVIFTRVVTQELIRHGLLHPE